MSSGLTGFCAMTTAIVNDWPIVALLMDRGARLAEVSKRGFKLTYLCEQAHPVPGSATDAALIRVRHALSDIFMAA